MLRPYKDDCDLIMASHFWLKLAAILGAVALCVVVFEAWRGALRDRDQLAAELATTKQLLASTDARQRDRDAQLSQTLASLAAEKRAVVTPAQVVQDLPKELPLPAPLVLQTPVEEAGSAASSAAQTPGTKTTPAQPQAVIPAADLKPLYDFTIDCKACQAKLATAQSDLTDEKAKTAALTKERDQALQIARGGNLWHRVGRAAKWFFIGAAAGAIAAKAAH